MPVLVSFSLPRQYATAHVLTNSSLPCAPSYWGEGMGETHWVDSWLSSSLSRALPVSPLAASPSQYIAEAAMLLAQKAAGKPASEQTNACMRERARERGSERGRERKREREREREGEGSRVFFNAAQWKLRDFQLHPLFAFPLLAGDAWSERWP